MVFVTDSVKDMMQSHLGYTKEEAELWAKNPKNARIMAAVPRLKEHTIVFEVIECKNCNSKHEVGTRFFFSADGNLLCHKSPKKACAYLLPNMTQTIYAMQELFYAGVEPNEMCFSRSGCFDVGVHCGGWGRVVIEAKAMHRDEARKLMP